MSSECCITIYLILTLRGFITLAICYNRSIILAHRGLKSRSVATTSSRNMKTASPSIVVSCTVYFCPSLSCPGCCIFRPPLHFRPSLSYPAFSTPVIFVFRHWLFLHFQLTPTPHDTDVNSLLVHMTPAYNGLFDILVSVPDKRESQIYPSP